MHNPFCLFSAALLCATPYLAMADESWTSAQYGEIIYGANVGDTAVLTMGGTHPGSKVQMYLPGLAENITTRGTYTGYWIENAPGVCSSEKTGADSLSSTAWGQLEVVFDSPTFPGAFTMRLGSCDDAFTDEGRAEPIEN